ncbi:MAG: hypothetical protein HY811_09730 [Planctomycetes bacterium]|nr:hypothetical protein [Planctomycetota bacterium]
MNKETIKRLVNVLYNELSTLSADNPSFYANIYAEKYNNILKEMKALYKDDSFIQRLGELPLAKDDNADHSKELILLFRDVNASVNQLVAFLE